MKLSETQTKVLNQMKPHDDFRPYKIFRRTYWTKIMCRIVRSYASADSGYIIEHPSGVLEAIPSLNLKEA